ncbi:MAG: DUF4292 domain-containing protein [Ignavibacterium sp.]
MRKIVFSFLLVLTLIELSLTGCVPSQPTEEVEILSADRLINRLEANRRRIKNFEGQGIITVNSSTLQNSATFRVVMVKPDSVYITFFGPFGIELAQAVATSSNFIFYDALQNTAYVGESDSDVLQNIFRINLSFSDIIDAFSGSVNLSQNLYKAPDKFEVIYDKYILTYINPENSLTSVYKIDVRRLGITEYTLNSDDGLINLEGKYSDFQIFENVAIPYKISILNKADSQKIDVEYRKISVNKKEIVIDFRIPDDATIIKW